MRQENVPPPAYRRYGPPGHRPSRSNEDEQRRMQNGARPRGPPQALDVFADPPSSNPARRSRRNSESSVVDKVPGLLDPEVERRRRERRHREREARHRGQKQPGSSLNPKKASRRLDIIDKLDVTSIYGTGCMVPLLNHSGIMMLTCMSSVPPRRPF